MPPHPLNIIIGFIGNAFFDFRDFEQARKEFPNIEFLFDAFIFKVIIENA